VEVQIICEQNEQKRSEVLNADLAKVLV